MILKKPKVPLNDNDSAPSSQEVAKFIAEGDKRPGQGKAIPRTFRLNPAFIDIMEAEAARTGLGNTDVLKAALAAYSIMTDNEKNHWLLEAKKL